MTNQTPGAEDLLVDTARQLLDELMPVLKAGCVGGSDEAVTLPTFTGGLGQWNRAEDLGDGMSIYRVVPRVVSAEEVCASRVLDELTESGFAPIRDFLAALEHDAIVGPRLDHLVSSSAAGGTTWQAAGLVRGLVMAAVAAAEAFDLQPSARDAVVERLVDDLRRSTDRITVVVVLEQFALQEPPLVLEGGVAIDELSEEEVSVALSSSARAGFPADLRSVGRVFGMRTSFETQLFAADALPPEQIEKDQSKRHDAWSLAESVLLGLRLFKDGPVRSSGSFDYSLSAVGVSSMHGGVSQWFGHPVGEPYVLTSDEASAFARFWKRFRLAQTRRGIEGALRRFGFAAERTRADDRIVDLMIGAESLFLSDIDPRDRGELRFRLAARSALLLGETLDERRQIAKFMRRAYDARSGIVHGGHPDPDQFRNLENHLISAEEFAVAVADVLRRSLRAAIERVGSGQRFPPDWDGLMFDSSSWTS